MVGASSMVPHKNVLNFCLHFALKICKGRVALHISVASKHMHTIH